MKTAIVKSVSGNLAKVRLNAEDVDAKIPRGKTVSVGDKVVVEMVDTVKHIIEVYD